MAKYKIVGPRSVAGSAPGKTVELDLPEANIAALVKAGHIAPVAAKPAAKVAGSARTHESGGGSGAAPGPIDEV